MQTKSKVAAGLLALFLGALGIHKFYLGYTVEGVIMLLITVLTAGLLSWLVAIVAFVEAIIYLTRSDEDFHRIYVVEGKSWF